MNKALACVLSLYLSAAPAFANKHSRAELEKARAQQQADLALVQHKTGGVEDFEVGQLVLATLIGATTGVLVGGAAALAPEVAASLKYRKAIDEFTNKVTNHLQAGDGIFSSVKEMSSVNSATAQVTAEEIKPVNFRAMPAEEFWSDDVFAAKMNEIYARHSELAQEALKRKSKWYPASKLGEENVQFLNEVLYRGIYNGGVDLPEFYPLVKNSANPKGYLVKPGKEGEFSKEVLRLFKKYREFNGKVAIPVSSSEGVTRRVFTSQLSDQFVQTIRQELVHGNKALLDCVDLVVLKEASAKRTIFPRGFKILGDRVIVKVLPLAAVAGVIGGWAWLSQSQKEEKMLQRVQQNPAMLLNLSDEDFALVSESEKLSEQYLAVCQGLHSLAQLPQASIKQLQQQYGSVLDQQKKLAKAALLKELRLQAN